MKYGFWGFGILMIGITGLVIIVMFETITLNNDSEYYNLKEAMEASMLEAIDYKCYRTSVLDDPDACDARPKIVEQKFVENFTRRFAESISGDVNSYTLKFYDIMEKPPKATVAIISSSDDFSYVLRSDSLNISNTLTGILETHWDREAVKTKVDNGGSVNPTSPTVDPITGTNVLFAVPKTTLKTISYIIPGSGSASKTIKVFDKDDDCVDVSEVCNSGDTVDDINPDEEEWEKDLNGSGTPEDKDELSVGNIKDDDSGIDDDED